MSQQKQWWCELLHPNPSFLLLSSTCSQSQQREERRKQRKHQKSRNPDPSVTLCQHNEQLPQGISHTCTSDLGGLCHLCSSQTPFLPASTNQIILQQVLTAQVARGLLHCCLGGHPWVLQAHPLLQDLSFRMCINPCLY